MNALTVDGPGFEIPLHRSLTEPILLGGAPRTVAIKGFNDPLIDDGTLQRTVNYQVMK